MSVVRQAIPVFFLFVGFGSSLPAQDAVKNRKPTLEERLKYGLRARTRDEKKFITTIVGMVNADKLKQKVVDESFFWVQREIERKKKGVSTRKHIEKYPFFYFKKILILKAKRTGVTIK